MKKDKQVDDTLSKLLSRLQVYKKEGKRSEFLFEQEKDDKIKLTISTFDVETNNRDMEHECSLSVIDAKRLRAMLEIHIRAITGT